MKASRTKILIALLGIAGLLLLWQSRAIFGMYFLFVMVALGCWALAFLLLLFFPWQKPALRKACRVLRWVYWAIALAIIISFAAVQVAIHRQVQAVAEQTPDAQCLLVLGAGLYGDTPSLVLQSRLEVALAYLQANPESVAVLSGGQGPGEYIPEALAMQRWLNGRGIADKRLHMEGRATSTGENIAFSKPIIEGLGYDTVVIVSNDFHLLRSGMLAAQQGLNAQLLGAPTPEYPLTLFTNYTREYFALVKDWLLGHLS